MSITGEGGAESAGPLKVGVGIADIMCGMYATVAVLAAVEARHKTGKGQHIDISLLDSQIAWLANQGVSYLVSGETPQPLGNAHPTIVPYETFPASDHAFILAVGNDAQFARFCAVAGCPALSDDPRFSKNADRVRNRAALIPLLQDITRARSAADWISTLETAGVPCGPINTIPEVFDDPQVQHRGMQISLPHTASAEGSVSLIGNPIKLSDTPVHYRSAPPQLGEHTRDILENTLSLSEETIKNLTDSGTVEAMD